MKATVSPPCCVVDGVAIAMQVPLAPAREWENFKNREPSLLTTDHKPLDPKDASGSDHALTNPVIEGHLSRKSTKLGRRTVYYVLSPAGFLLEYPDKDPATNPEASLSSVRMVEAHWIAAKLLNEALGYYEYVQLASLKGKCSVEETGKLIAELRTAYVHVLSMDMAPGSQWILNAFSSLYD